MKTKSKTKKEFLARYPLPEEMKAREMKAYKTNHSLALIMRNNAMITLLADMYTNNVHIIINGTKEAI